MIGLMRGFTVILELKDLLGVEAVVKDHRGSKGPYKYAEGVLDAVRWT